ncbi:MAG: fructose-bisphosphate aldolase class I [Candidatus Saccharibacteria bacterium]|nr:fructose-bisphosphate aldolase class I [Candidatus Saccharibacteria bacterium]
MNILIVGNLLKDIYLNLDNRTEHLETDNKGTKWLDLSFDASRHYFFNRNSSLGGAAVSLETLQKLGLEARISDSDLDFNDTATTHHAIPTHRYILIDDSRATYFAPSTFTKSSFTPPDQPIDYLYLDRSAEITSSTSQQIIDFLEHHPQTRLIVYVRNFHNQSLNSLLSHASLIFSEIENAPELANYDPSKVITVTEKRLGYLDISEDISIDRIDVLTHLSLYSITAATIFGCFVLGHSVENSLRYARLNAEHSKLDATLTLHQLQSLEANAAPENDPRLIATNLVLPPRGILAADESGGSIHKKFDQLNIPDTYDNRRDYRNLFFTTPDLEKYVNGVILFDETARQTADNGQDFVSFLTARRIIPGIKVDQGLEKFENSEETYTKGLEGLSSRLKEYYNMGLRFAKWRAAFEIRLDDQGNFLTPSDHAITENCRILAEYAKECQSAKLVPIVEPEVVYDGNYSIDQSADTTAKILDQLFQTLVDAHVDLAACLLKVNMVLAGKQFSTPSTPTEVGSRTAEVLKNHVPEALAGVVFLSGGQTPEQATDNLAAVTENGPFPWPVTFSFARALQDPTLYAWKGDNTNQEAAQATFLERLKKTQAALKKEEE